jgi:hypothetical protein
MSDASCQEICRVKRSKKFPGTMIPVDEHIFSDAWLNQHSIERISPKNILIAQGLSNFMMVK